MNQFIKIAFAFQESGDDFADQWMLYLIAHHTEYFSS